MRYQHIFACGFTCFELQFFLFLISFVVSKTCMFFMVQTDTIISSFSITKHGFLEDLKLWINQQTKWGGVVVFSVVKLGAGFNNFYFHPYLGKIPILTNIFQMC